MHRKRSWLTSLMLVSFAVVYSGCASVVPFVKPKGDKPYRVVLLTNDVKASSTVTNGASGSLLVFGLVGGLVAGGIDAAINNPRTEILERAMKDFDIAADIEKRFLVSLNEPSPIEIISARKIYSPEDQEKIKKFYKRISNPSTAAPTKNRADETRQKVIEEKEVNKGRVFLAENNIDAVMMLSPLTYGVSGLQGNEDYVVSVEGRMISVAAPSKKVWQRVSTTEKRPDAKKTRINFTTEKNLGMEHIRNSLLFRVQYVCEELANDFN